MDSDLRCRERAALSGDEHDHRRLVVARCRAEGHHFSEWYLGKNRVYVSDIRGHYQDKANRSSEPVKLGRSCWRCGVGETRVFKPGSYYDPSTGIHHLRLNADNTASNWVTTTTTTTTPYEEEPPADTAPKRYHPTKRRAWRKRARLSKKESRRRRRR